MHSSQQQIDCRESAVSLVIPTLTNPVLAVTRIRRRARPCRASCPRSRARSRAADRLGAIISSAILEVANQFLLLGVDGDDGLLLGLRHNDFRADVFELGVSVRMFRAFIRLTIRWRENLTFTNSVRTLSALIGCPISSGLRQASPCSSTPRSRAAWDRPASRGRPGA